MVLFLVELIDHLGHKNGCNNQQPWICAGSNPASAIFPVVACERKRSAETLRRPDFFNERKFKVEPDHITQRIIAINGTIEEITKAISLLTERGYNCVHQLGLKIVDLAEVVEVLSASIELTNTTCDQPRVS